MIQLEIIFLDKISDIWRVLPSLSEEDYYNRIDAIKANLKKCQNEFDVLEDFIYEKYFKVK